MSRYGDPSPRFSEAILAQLKSLVDAKATRQLRLRKIDHWRFESVQGLGYNQETKYSAFIRACRDNNVTFKAWTHSRSQELLWTHASGRSLEPLPTLEYIEAVRYAKE